MFQFTEAMKTHITHIDNQHRELVELVNQAASFGAKNPSRIELKTCLDFLGEYVVKHFGDEEKLQIACGYANYGMHKRIHDDFINTFMGIYAEFENGGSADRISYIMGTAVSQWLISHIKSEDIRFSKYFAMVMEYDLYETKGNEKNILFRSIPLNILPTFLATHYGITHEHARETTEMLERGEHCPPFGYASRILSLECRRQS